MRSLVKTYAALDIPWASKNRAILFLSLEGMVGRISLAVSRSPRRIAVWYSTTMSDKAKLKIFMSLSAT